jgi:amino acid transporter
VFAISFAFISVAVGAFGTYDDVPVNTGPVGIWLWVVAAVGQILIALAVAQFAARIALSGSSYQWASRLANPKIGWGFGWLSFCYLAIGVVAVDNAPGVHAAVRHGTGRGRRARVITLVVLLIQAVLAIASTRIVAMINSGAVGLELVIVVVLAVALVVAVVVTGTGSTDNLISRGIAEHAPNYFAVGGGMMLAMIMRLAMWDAKCSGAYPPSIDLQVQIQKELTFRVPCLRITPGARFDLCPLSLGAGCAVDRQEPFVCVLMPQ